MDNLTASGDIAALVERLELLAAWRKPGGRTPKQKMPNTYTAVVEAMTTITTLQAEVERKDAALDNIRALAVKSQRVGGPNGTLAHIEGFARAALERAKP